MLFQGSMTAHVTPFREGSVYEAAFRALIDWQIASGTDVLVPCGTTGEAVTLSYEEVAQVIRITVEQAAGRVPVLAGAGSNSTANAVRIGRIAKEAGADGVKLEGGALRVPTVKALTDNGIPVLAHIGLTPQNIQTLGGYKVQGRKPVEARRLL